VSGNSKNLDDKLEKLKAGVTLLPQRLATLKSIENVLNSTGEALNSIPRELNGLDESIDEAKREIATNEKFLNAQPSGENMGIQGLAKKAEDRRTELQNKISSLEAEKNALSQLSEHHKGISSMYSRYQNDLQKGLKDKGAIDIIDAQVQCSKGIDKILRSNIPHEEKKEFIAILSSRVDFPASLEPQGDLTSLQNRITAKLKDGGLL
jgi:chromosome segregation ATPase